MRERRSSRLCVSPGKSIQNVTFQNIVYTGKGWPGVSIIAGYDEPRQVSDVVFENVIINNRTLHARAAGVLEVGSFVNGVKFK